ncbi:hypothetical protein DVS28_a2490 [Euzebya pacifica]|uniref:Uncharacterized protein n=1 Tax=Euzebya pacifica TaxID=1608957 RepID=A0A346XY74_9ACTN|nr:hypothetical protein [Euzebya pacifica]AXV07171.1 hypothetical protein DVS28_a2490 [Euzebya pacifica]
MTTPNQIRRPMPASLVLLGLLAAPDAAHSALQSADPAPDSGTDQPVDTLSLFAWPIEGLRDSVQATSPVGQTQLEPVGPPTASPPLNRPLWRAEASS